MPTCCCTNCFPKKTVAIGTLKKHLALDRKRLNDPLNTDAFKAAVRQSMALCSQEIQMFNNAAADGPDHDDQEPLAPGDSDEALADDADDADDEAEEARYANRERSEGE
ncbi:hypothetical protein FA95DRAFT_1613405 [Auriscalpium vulgare]|uniref:Uncharacterized protein n=1 Tax=Auriscalpium vulgare TaxID=40419 RepID=A0ACB8R479_9AGAM|nr:hypothetical protein FA95DRAFT_1613405 [Auriscalpium vulgare]